MTFTLTTLMRYSKGWLYLLAVLLVLRVCAPYAVKAYVNQLIADAPGISGHVKDVDLHLYRGAYVLKGVNIQQLDDKGTHPFIASQTIEISLLWRELVQGQLRSELIFTKPTIVLASSPEQDAIKSDAILDKQTWTGLVNGLVAFAVDSLQVKQGEFRFVASRDDQQAQFFINETNGYVVNASGANTQQQAEFNISGQVLGKAKLVFKGKFDPSKQQPDFDVDLSMSRLPSQYLSKIVDFYAPFDFEAGEVDLTAELGAQKGKVNGYVKGGIYHLEIFSWHEDVVEDQDDPFTLLAEMASAFISEIFENQKHDLIATRVPVTGSLDDPDISTFDALLGILRNAFIQAYQMNIEQLISFDDGSSKSDKTSQTHNLTSEQGEKHEKQ